MAAARESGWGEMVGAADVMVLVVDVWNVDWLEYSGLDSGRELLKKEPETVAVEGEGYQCRCTVDDDSAHIDLYRVPDASHRSNHKPELLKRLYTQSA